MGQLTINVIGAGKLGKTIAKLIVSNNAGFILGVCNKNICSSKAAVTFIGQGEACQDIADLPIADVTFITVPDDSIESTCLALCASKNFNPSATIIHCSGLLTSNVLTPAKNKGASIVSVHPMHSFAEPSFSLQEFANTYCTMEGEQKAEFVARKIFEKIGGIVKQIPKNKKAIYHAGCVFATNYLVTLADTAVKCMQETSINDDDAVNIIMHMMNSTLKNMQQTKLPHEALTGPIKRGDLQTIKDHLTTIDDKVIKDLYISLANATLAITKLDHKKKQMISDALQN